MQPPEKLTYESITNSLKEMAEKREVVPPDVWLRGAVKLNVLLEEEVEKLINKEHIVANMRRILLEEGKTASYTKMMVEASEEYRSVQIQKAKISNAQETIKLAKKYAQLASDQMRSGL